MKFLIKLMKKARQRFTSASLSENADWHLFIFAKIRLRGAQHHLRRSRNIIGRKPPSFATCRNIVHLCPPCGGMMLPFGQMMLRASTQMMLCPADTNEKILKAMLSGFFGGATRNRTGDKGVADLCLTAWLWRRVFTCSTHG